jgi:hypothetical protein
MLVIKVRIFTKTARMPHLVGEDEWQKAVFVKLKGDKNNLREFEGLCPFNFSL